VCAERRDRGGRGALAYDDYGAPRSLTIHGRGTGRTDQPDTNGFCYPATLPDHLAAALNRHTGYYDIAHAPYDPTVGRFLSRDRIGIWADPLGWSMIRLYSNNPWSYSIRLGWTAIIMTSHGTGLDRNHSQKMERRTPDPTFVMIIIMMMPIPMQTNWLGIYITTKGTCAE
jgi:hypothetical protein